MSLADVLAGRRGWEVITAHVLDGLRQLPDACVQVCVTSPPYWGLRSYSTAPVVMGGAADCGHAWADLGASGMRSRNGQGETTLHETGPHGTQPHGEQQTPKLDASVVLHPSQGATCTRCGAWRGELGSEPTPALFVAHLVAVLREVRRVLRDDGSVWLNIADSYSGSGKGTPGPNALINHTGRQGFAGPGREARDGLYERRPTGQTPDGIPAKSLCLIPERLAIALADDGWIVRSRIAWCKLAPMPEPVTDRPTSAWEHLWLLTKRPTYYYDADVVRQPASIDSHGGRLSPYSIAMQTGGQDSSGLGIPAASAANLRNWWALPPEPFNGARFLRDVDGGTGRKLSPDCPVHGAQAAQVPEPSDDELLGASQSAHNPHTGAGLAQSPDAGPPSTHIDQAASLFDSQTAMPRSSETSRTDELSAPHGTDGAESAADIACSEPLFAGLATSDHTPESRTEADSDVGDSGSNPSAETAGDNAGKCTCRIIDHFAVFPTAIPRRAILAGTSAHGACAACGAPWRRVVERGNSEHHCRAGCGHMPFDFSEGWGHPRYGAPTTRATNAWQPTCPCADPRPPVPQLVLDPFSGAGTTGLVARQLGRRYVGLELNPDYAEMSRQRIANDAPLVEAVSAAEAWQQASLFEEVSDAVS